MQAFPVESSCECRRCAAELSHGASLGQVRTGCRLPCACPAGCPGTELRPVRQDLRERGEVERAALPALASGAAPVLEPGAALCLLPHAWLVQWRAFLAGAAKRSGSSSDLQPLAPLGPALGELMCCCHAGEDARLGFRPPSVARR